MPRDSRYHVYVLECGTSGGKFYVGSTNNLERRMQEHFSGKGAAWTKIYKPQRQVKSTISFSKQHAMEQEDVEVKRMMNEHGIGNVRGGTYSKPRLDTIALTALQRELNHQNDKCLNCGQFGHYVAECPYSEKNLPESNATHLELGNCSDTESCDEESSCSESSYESTSLCWDYLSPMSFGFPF